MVKILWDLSVIRDLWARSSTSYSVDSVFEKFGAYPQQWIENADGEIVYGSLTEETKEALGYLRELYRQGILDSDFALRAQNNIRDLVVNGKCGAFFGLWWTPNNPLMVSIGRIKRQTGNRII